MDEVAIRPASPEDAGILVDLVSMAGSGIPERVWAEMAGPGETFRDVGLRRAGRDEGGFSWRNGWLVEKGGVVAGGLIGTRLPEIPVVIGPDFPAAFVLLQELENLVCGAWYINILAVYPGFRGQGIGAALLAKAGALAAETGAEGLALIVMAENEGAVRLYARQGFTEAARRQVSAPGWPHDGAAAVLMVTGHASGR